MCVQLVGAKPRPDLSAVQEETSDAPKVSLGRAEARRAEELHQRCSHPHQRGFGRCYCLDQNFSSLELEG